LPLTLSILLRLGQGAQFVVPFTFKGVCDQANAGIDQHEAPLHEIGLELGPFNGAKPEPIGFVMTGFKLLAGKPVTLFARSEQLLSTDGPPIVSPAIDVCARIAGIHDPTVPSPSIMPPWFSKP